MKKALLVMVLVVAALPLLLPLGGCGAGGAALIGVGTYMVLEDVYGDPYYDPYCDCYYKRLEQEQIDPASVPGEKW